MIRKTKEGKFKVQAESGRPMGEYPSKDKALKRLRQIEAWKTLNKHGVKSFAELEAKKKGKK